MSTVKTPRRLREIRIDRTKDTVLCLSENEYRQFTAQYKGDYLIINVGEIRRHIADVFVKEGYMTEAEANELCPERVAPAERKEPSFIGIGNGI